MPRWQAPLVPCVLIALFGNTIFAWCIPSLLGASLGIFLCMRSLWWPSYTLAAAYALAFAWFFPAISAAPFADRSA